LALGGAASLVVALVWALAAPHLVGADPAGPRRPPPARAACPVGRYGPPSAGPPAELPTELPPRPPAAGSWRSRYAVAADAEYRSPVQLVANADGSRLYVSCEDQDAVLEVDSRRGEVVRRLEVGSFPFALALNEPAGRLYVSNRRDDSVSELDLSSGDQLRTLPAGDDPHGVALEPSSDALWVAALATHDLVRIDLRTGQQSVRLEAGRFPFALALSPDGSRVYASSQMTLPVPFRQPPALELTAVGVNRGQVVRRTRVEGTVIGQGVAASPDGAFVVMALEIPRNLLPETQIYQGWMVTYALAVVPARGPGRVALLPLDEPNRYYADPYGVAFSHDGQRLYVTHSGVDTLSVLSWPRVLQRLQVSQGRIGLEQGELERLSAHLAASEAYVVARVPTGRNPKGLVVSPDDSRVYVANRLSDSITVVDTSTLQPIEEIKLGGPTSDTLLRRGAVVFHYATISFQQQLSCNTCHPENLVDGLIYDIAADGGMGRNLTDNRTLRGIAATAPFKWSGRNPTLQRQEGPRAAQLFFRSHGYVPADVEAITAFIESMPLEPNRHRGERLDEFQARGKLAFERTRTNDGRHIPVANRCVTCHPPPHYTDRLLHDVGTQAPFDDERVFDTPGLNNIYEQAPFLHDGRCWSLEEIWTLYNPYDTHGVTNDMTKEQLNDLIEYLKVL